MDRFSFSERRVITLAALGGMLEFYDFIIYAVFSIYFADQFFPGGDTLVVVLKTYMVFVLGYIARPLGGILFSHIGDEYGRKRVLITTLLLMGIASFGIAVLPTYASIGISAPILLISLRILQGLALGGELPSTYVYIREIIQHRQGLAFGIVMCGVHIGLVIGILINFILNKFLSATELAAFGWRLPFLLGSVICLISYKIRQTLHETPAFQATHAKPRFPLAYVFKHHCKELLISAGLTAPMGSLVVVTLIFMPTYLSSVLQVDKHSISSLMNFASIANLICIYLGAILADRVGGMRLFGKVLLCAPLIIIVSYGLAYLQQFYLAVMCLSMLQGCFAVLTPLIITTIFNPVIRLTGVALSYNISLTIFGGLAPLIITHGIRFGYNAYIMPAVYLLIMLGLGGLGFVGLQLTDAEKNNRRGHESAT